MNKPKLRFITCAAELEALRVQLNYSHFDFARYLGLSRSTYYRYATTEKWSLREIVKVNGAIAYRAEKLQQFIDKKGKKS